MEITILTIVLIVITAWYAYQTHRMANIMTKDYENKISPIIEFERGSAENSADYFRFSYRIKNYGNNICFVGERKILIYLAENEDINHEIILSNDEEEVNPGTDGLLVGKTIYRKDIPRDEMNRIVNDHVMRFGKEIKVALIVDIAGIDKNYQKRRINIYN